MTLIYFDIDVNVHNVTFSTSRSRQNYTVAVLQENPIFHSAGGHIIPEVYGHQGV